jgi:predicted nucleotidyltransferase
MTDKMLTEFVDQVRTRYPVDEILLFGSRGRAGRPRPDSDWDIIVYVTDDNTTVIRALLSDASLRRHFDTYLDLFVVESHGRWWRPIECACGNNPRPPFCEGCVGACPACYGWFPARYEDEIIDSLTSIWTRSES